MIASLFIIGFSLILFLYWFRYTCLLVLSAKPARDYTKQVAAANQLSFVEVEDQIAEVSVTDHLDNLSKSLDRDYRLLTCLMRHAAGFQLGGYDLEHRMLMIDFAVMRGWYALAKKFSMPQARSALREMATIVGHFANATGERGAATAGV